MVCYYDTSITCFFLSDSFAVRLLNFHSLGINAQLVHNLQRPVSQPVRPMTRKGNASQQWNRWLLMRNEELVQFCHHRPVFNGFLIECRTVGCIEMKMGDLNSASTAGAILQHAIRTLERLFVEQEPLIFKIGFSHNPLWRWTNDVYGYQHAREKWSNMDILFYCKEPYSPAMLEAALVEKFKSTHSAENNCSYFLCFFKYP